MVRSNRMNRMVEINGFNCLLRLLNKEHTHIAIITLFYIFFYKSVYSGEKVNIAEVERNKVVHYLNFTIHFI